MRNYYSRELLLLIASACVFYAGACTGPSANNTTANNAPVAENPQPSVTPSNQITEGDIAKLKWLEGTWRSSEGGKPFFQRIRFDGTTMIVESYEDEKLLKLGETARFELRDGEFGHTVGDQRSAASSITENSVHFVPAPSGPGAPVKGSTFRFERGQDGTWQAILQPQPSAGRQAPEKTYKMEPLQPRSAN